MKKLAIFALATMAVLCLSASAFGQPENGDLGVFFDLNGMTASTTATNFQIVNVYVAGYNLGPVAGWESSVTISNPAYNVFAPVLNPSDAVNAGSTGNWIVGLGICANVPGVHTLVSYQVGFFTPPPAAVPELLICTGASTPSSFGGAPGYSSCTDVLIPFGQANNGGGTAYPNGCGVINPTSTPPVATHDLSFGAVKAGY
jgi:hypothetical protein